MARRVRYRDRVTQRFVSPANAEELDAIVSVFDTETFTRTTYSYSEYQDFLSIPEEEMDANIWSIDPTERGWIAQPGEDSSDLFGLEPPPGATSFRVFVDVEDNPDYPRGWASTGWQGLDSWPPSPSMVKNVDATGFNHIRFS
jgi:hypothetical protein